MLHDNDAVLVDRLFCGDEAAYSELYRRHERRAYRVALAAVRTPWDAEDVVASTFLELWRKRDGIRVVDGSVLPWLLTVVSYAAKNHERSTRRYRRLIAKVPSEGVEPDHADEVDRRVDALPSIGEVRRAVAELDTTDLRMLWLCLVQEQSSRDVALALGMPMGTVKSRLSRLRARLRARLRGFAPAAEGNGDRRTA